MKRIANRNIFLWIMTLILLLILSVAWVHKDGSICQRTAYLLGNPGDSELFIEDIGLTVRGWDSYGVTYYFIPSYAKIAYINYDEAPIKIYSLDGKLLERPIFNSVMDVLVEFGGVLTPYQVAFCQSSNLYTINIEMNDEDDIYALSKEASKSISFNVISPDGITEYSEPYAMITGRGNYSFDQCIKKSYEVKIPEKVSIMGMTKGRSWALINNASDQTRLCNKIAYDTSAALGMEYFVESDWADVYIDGVYWGNYLICHEPDIGSDGLNIRNLQKENEAFFYGAIPFNDAGMKGYDYILKTPDDISGGYLIEVDGYMDRRKCGFYLDDVFFYVKSPNNASREELKYIESYMVSIDRKIRNNNGSEILSIDYSSFAKRYIIEEMLCNYDSMMHSYFFYKKSGSDILFAGPCWDYDRNAMTLEANKRVSILELEGIRLDWDRILMANESYREYICFIFERYAYIFDKLIDSQIDVYYEKIQDSLHMDYLRWNKIDEAVMGESSDNPEGYISELKKFLFERLCFIGKQIGSEHIFVSPDSN